VPPIVLDLAFKATQEAKTPVGSTSSGAKILLDLWFQVKGSD